MGGRSRITDQRIATDRVGWMRARGRAEAGRSGAKDTLRHSEGFAGRPIEMIRAACRVLSRKYGPDRHPQNSAAAIPGRSVEQVLVDRETPGLPAFSREGLDGGRSVEPGCIHAIATPHHESLPGGRIQSPRLGTLNIHASGNATTAASADITNAFRYPPMAAWR